MGCELCVAREAEGGEKQVCRSACRDDGARSSPPTPQRLLDVGGGLVTLACDDAQATRPPPAMVGPLVRVGRCASLLRRKGHYRYDVHDSSWSEL
eukprot:289675-Prymnesium_polylepis.1